MRLIIFGGLSFFPVFIWARRDVDGDETIRKPKQSQSIVLEAGTSRVLNHSMSSGEDRCVGGRQGTDGHRPKWAMLTQADSSCHIPENGGFRLFILEVVVDA